MQVFVLEGIVKQLSQDLSEAETQLKAADRDKASAGSQQSLLAQQALTPQVEALNARVCCKIACSSPHAQKAHVQFIAHTSFCTSDWHL